MLGSWKGPGRRETRESTGQAASAEGLVSNRSEMASLFLALGGRFARVHGGTASVSQLTDEKKDSRIPFPSSNGRDAGGIWARKSRMNHEIAPGIHLCYGNQNSNDS